MINHYNHILLTALILLIPTTAVIAQDSQKKNTRIQVEYIKDHNKSESIVTTLKISEDRYVPYEDAEINLYSISDTSKVLLDKLRTDKNGQAIYLIEDPQNIYKDSLGVMTFEVEYNGNASSKVAKRKIQVKQVNLKIPFFQEDTNNHTH